MVRRENPLGTHLPLGQRTMILLSTAYLAPVEYYVQLYHHPAVIEQYDHYGKQSYRNRCVIAATNGLQTLSIPVEKPDSPKCFMRDIRIAEHGGWRHLHWNAIVSAYRSSPFFEYYEDDFRPFYEKKYEFLFDFNEQLRELTCRLLHITPIITYSTEYQKDIPNNVVDLREAIHPKKPSYLKSFIPYYQVFEQKFGFQANLSIIDLLFNMGNESQLIIHKCSCPI